MPTRAPAEPPARIQIENPSPVVAAGRFPAKRCVGDVVSVGADIFRDGHDLVRAVVRFRAPGAETWNESPLHAIDAAVQGVAWAGSFPVDAIGRWEFDIEAWTDLFATWRDELRRKVEAGQIDLSGELGEGEALLERAAARLEGEDAQVVEAALSTLRDGDAAPGVKHAAALDPRLLDAMSRDPHRHGAARLPQAVGVEVDRERARFGAWYELFPRSFGGLQGVERRLPELAELGFDVLYLPPIHPIGVKNRKGRNNSLIAGPDDPGSPWAIGSPDGGHDAVHPELGTVDDLRRLAARGRELGIDVALDFAIQCSADHPWLTEHPEWFHRRPDGTLKYAENPPKKYQDIYNVNWDTEDWQALWAELRRITLQWVDCGVKVFRVDNPHTKPIRFWEWLIAEVHAVDRDIIFLAEAFTRRAMMRQLAKIGFTQSYTYFTWKTSRFELTEYVSELAHGEEREYFRPNFFANTPDILHESLVHGGPPMFTSRLALAATLSPTYGIYSGYEHFENVAVRPGSEEYLDSEKYEIKERSLDGPLLPAIAKLNHLRRRHPALQRVDTVRFFATENEALIGYTKVLGDDAIVVVVNIDPRVTQEGVADVPVESGLPSVFHVRDAVSEQEFDWVTGRNFVRLGPGDAHVLEVVR